MTNYHTLLSFIAHRHTIGLEDVATDALCFVLSRSEAARAALADCLGDGGAALPIADAQSWLANEHGAVPDLACVNAGGEVVALIESKFWAPLTRHQPVTYWEALPTDKPSALLFLAPDYRVNQGSLWNELTERLQRAGHELIPNHIENDLKAATGNDDHRRLVLASWSFLLDRLAQRVLTAGDHRASFEIAELQGLAANAISGGNPRRDENLKGLMAESVKRVEQSGWADSSGLTVGQGFGYYVRYLRLARAHAWLGIDYRAADQIPEKPLWLSFYPSNASQVGLEEIQSKLGDLSKPGLEWRPNEICVPIEFPAGADQEATLGTIVSALEHIAKLIDPTGPTYIDQR